MTDDQPEPGHPEFTTEYNRFTYGPGDLEIIGADGKPKVYVPPKTKAEADAEEQRFLAAITSQEQP